MVTQPSSAEIDVDQLVAKIREEVTRHRAEGRVTAPTPRQPDPYQAMAGWSVRQASLETAERHARVATFVPDWPHWNRLKRGLGRLTARLVMHLSVFITNQQREFNLAILQGLREMDTAVRQLEAGLRQTQGSLALLEDLHRSGLERVERRLAQPDPEIAGLRDGAAELDRRVARLQTNLAIHEHRVSLLLEEARRRLPAPFHREQVEVMAEEAQRLLDGFHANLQDRFRGTREEIKHRMRVYVPVVKEVGPGTVLDLGCGRGEWLEILRDEGVPARGVEVNRLMVERCRERGLDVTEGEILQYLRRVPDASLAAVSAIHVIEHLPFEALIELLDHTVRVLRPGGVAIFETPNPANISVGSCNFYQDPTHRAPVPSPLAQHVAEARGLCRVGIVPLHPYPESFRLGGSELADRFSEYFYGPQDYAVIGYKV